MTQLQNRPPSREEFFQSLKGRFRPEERAAIGRAYQFSKTGHAKQLRDDGGRYFDHPKSVAWIAMTELGIFDWKVIVEALLHDMREDQFLLTHDCIVLNFGIDVAYGVEALTKRPEEKDNLQAYMERVMAEGWRTILVKIIDRLHNLRTLGNCTPEKRERKREETRQLFPQLLERLCSLVPGTRLPIVEKLERLFEKALNG